MASDSDRDDSSSEEIQQLPLLPLRDTIVFPGMNSTLFVGREKSILALEHVEFDPTREILLVAQKEARTQDPGPDDIFEVGTVGYVSNLERIHDGNRRLLAEAERATAG
jgi:ATP-dependent Lon protease